MRKQHGFSLLEIAIVVFILGIVAAVAVPSFTSTSSKKIDIAAQQVADALRFARSEAIRTRSVQYVTISQTTQKVTLSKADLTTSPVSEDYTLTHPIDKKPYDFNINTQSITGGVVIANAQDAFLFTTLGRRKSLLFDEHGTPIWLVNSSSTTYQLGSGVVTLNHEDRQLNIIVEPGTGRVIVQ